MTRDEHLEFCKICMNQKFSMKEGIICKLTNQIADFEDNCNLFEEDNELKSRLYRTFDGSHEQLASMGKRVANLVLDTIFYVLAIFLMEVIILIISPSLITIFNGENELLLYLFVFVVTFLYYSAFETLTGRTIAKYITKTKVVDENGNKPNYVTILLRTICRFIPFDYFTFLGTDNSGWHDQFSKTKVIEI